MELKTAERIVRKLNTINISAQVFPEYSGRCMYGRTTVGVVIDKAYLANDAELCCPILKTSRTDSLGLGMIFY